jgi:hypothetical protein
MGIRKPSLSFCQKLAKSIDDAKHQVQLENRPSATHRLYRNRSQHNNKTAFISLPAEIRHAILPLVAQDRSRSPLGFTREKALGLVCKTFQADMEVVIKERERLRSISEAQSADNTPSSWLEADTSAPLPVIPPLPAYLGGGNVRYIPHRSSSARLKERRRLEALKAKKSGRAAVNLKEKDQAAYQGRKRYHERRWKPQSEAEREAVGRWRAIRVDGKKKRQNTNKLLNDYCCD